MARKHKYVGVLGERSKPSALWFAAALKPEDAQLQLRARRELDAQFLALVNALLVDCGAEPIAREEHIPAANWTQVALVLATRHVPAFEPMINPFDEMNADDEKKIGRPRKTAIDADFEFYRKVIARIQDGQSEQAAIKNTRTALRLSESEAALGARYRRTRGRIEAGRDLFSRVIGYFQK